MSYMGYNTHRKEEKVRQEAKLMERMRRNMEKEETRLEIVKITDSGLNILKITTKNHKFTNLDTYTWAIQINLSYKWTILKR